MIAELPTPPRSVPPRAARGEPHMDSDMDILIETGSDAPVGGFEYVGIVHLMADMFPTRVDVAWELR